MSELSVFNRKKQGLTIVSPLPSSLRNGLRQAKGDRIDTYAYDRVSTKEQILDRQLIAMENYSLIYHPCFEP